MFAYFHVDHFRPKKTYWWLAFDWQNYRLSGSVGNVKKRTSFPLHDEARRATGPESPLCDEAIHLLDPTRENDPMLLTFDESGHAKPAADEGNWIHERAETTIDLLNLNYVPLVEGRKRVWQRCTRLLNNAQTLMQNPANQVHFEYVIGEMRSMLGVEAELSMTARACLLNASVSRDIEWPMNLI